MDYLKQKIRTIPDFPKPGILFRDITTLLADPKAFNSVINMFVKHYQKEQIDLVVGIESRGFISASALAFKLELGFIPIRKPNKLPGNVKGINYKLEYGEDRLEIQQNSIEKDSKIILIDDLLATGGTAGAAGKLIREAGGNLIGYGFLVELTELNGRNKLETNSVVESIIKY